MGAWPFRYQASLRTCTGGKDEEMGWKLERVQHAAIARDMEEEVEDACVSPGAWPAQPFQGSLWGGGTHTGGGRVSTPFRQLPFV